MKCEVLTSVMNQKNMKNVVSRLGISKRDRCIIINQITENMMSEVDIESGVHRFLSFKEKGLGRSRNHALENAIGDICIICDDDCRLATGYEKKIEDAYRVYADADIVAFDFVRADGSRKTMKEGKVGFLRSMKLSSVQITFKRESIRKARVRFDEDFGTGSDKYNWGEENIFLFDCLRAGLKIYYVPIVIIMIEGNCNTTWDRSSTSEHFEQQGAIYYRMTPRFWRVLALQFVFRKRKIYSSSMRGVEVYKSMRKGAKKYKMWTDYA